MMSAIRHYMSRIPLLLLLLGASGGANADQFIGFAQAGQPGWAFQTYPYFSRNQAGYRSAGAHNVLAWFSEKGLPGTQGDQFEVWAGLSAGHASQHGRGGWGVAAPQLGLMYYHHAVRSESEPGADGYLSYWFSPMALVNFPNGRTQASGYGAGSNHYGLGLTVANYLQVGRLGMTVNPLFVYYASPERHHVTDAAGVTSRHRSGLSLTLMDMAAGYQARPDLFVGLHHSYHIYGARHASTPTVREGKLGPAFSYTGWLRHGIFFAANLNFTYYATQGTPRSTSLAAVITKSF
ncbi:hypothetical protein GSY71_10510 [Pusillimonas sp. TS35]|uniref:hypothetical protein n=1 Tax=Paracandidimonas lactea TaxID=2895524 RepID=UPI00137147B2|nr:hypothetical protein [Paracandidimonas lactea]MYN13565.1 hypothetical protein [Pusillimonas sp. TS35]